MVKTGQLVILEKMPMMTGVATRFEPVQKKKQKFPLHPKHPERICWGCDKYCPADSLLCGNGSGRTEHPMEIMGDDWYTWGDWAKDFDPDQKKSE